eukprot:Clim_evm10s220 gene=Clim_evmTU10s220
MGGHRYSQNKVNKQWDMTKCASSSGSYMRVHFKNTHETAQAIKGMSIDQATQYLQDVKAHKRIIPFRRFRYGVGRKAQTKEFKTPQGRWPEKSCDFMLSMLANLKSNGEGKGLDAGSLIITHVQVNMAPVMRRRTYRAHGRINPYKSHPCHYEFIAVPPAETVPRPEAVSKQ